jgi:hypothetical protein
MTSRSDNSELTEATRELPGYGTDDPTRPADDTERGDGEERVDDGRRGGVARGLFWLVATIGLVAVLVLGSQVAGLLPNFGNPFKKETTDRSQPPLLQSIQDLSRYVAAEGNFQVVVDLQKNRKYVPDFLLNQRTLFVGAGTVEAYVDFGTIGEGAVTESADGKSATIRLPDPQLGEVNLNLERSYVFAEQRGILNQLGEVFGGDPNRQREVYLRAEQDIAAAAKSSGLVERARDNTRKMLEGLLRSLGYTSVTVTYAAT